MRIILIGAGQVGSTIVEALHDEHDVTVVDLDEDRLTALSYRYDVRTIEGNGATRSVLQDAGIQGADLMIACTSRDEINLVASMLAKRLSDVQTIVRATNVEYLDAWRERQIEVDFVVSSELETAHAVSGHIGIPAARQTDVFADGQVQIVEFDVPTDAPQDGVIGRKLRDAARVARLPRHRDRPRLPRARAHRPVPGGHPRDARGREEPPRRHPRARPRRPLHVRDRPRPDLDRGLRAGRHRRRRQPALGQ